MTNIEIGEKIFVNFNNKIVETKIIKINLKENEVDWEEKKGLEQPCNCGVAGCSFSFDGIEISHVKRGKDNRLFADLDKWLSE